MLVDFHSNHSRATEFLFAASLADFLLPTLNHAHSMVRRSYPRISPIQPPCLRGCLGFAWATGFKGPDLPSTLRLSTQFKAGLVGRLLTRNLAGLKSSTASPLSLHGYAQSTNVGRVYPSSMSLQDSLQGSRFSHTLNLTSPAAETMAPRSLYFPQRSSRGRAGRGDSNPGVLLHL